MVPGLVQVGRLVADMVVVVTGQVHRLSQLAFLHCIDDVVVDVSLEHVRRDRGSTLASERVANTGTKEQSGNSGLLSQDDALHESGTSGAKDGTDFGDATHVLELETHDIELLIGEVLRVVEQLLQLCRHCF